MKGPEAKFYQWLKRTFSRWDFQRIETTTGLGVPDVHICAYQGTDKVPVEFWAELKALPLTNVQIRKYQFAFMARRPGANCWVINRDPKQKIISAWKYPFSIEAGQRDHVKITSSPTIQLVEEQFRHLEGKDFQNN